MADRVANIQAQDRFRVRALLGSLAGTVKQKPRIVLQTLVPTEVNAATRVMAITVIASRDSAE